MSSSEFRHYTRDEFLAEFYPDPADKAAIAAGMEQLLAEQRALVRHHRTAHPGQALDGRLEIIASFGGHRLAFAEPGSPRRQTKATPA
jgi:hypothetical protein